MGSSTNWRSGKARWISCSNCAIGRSPKVVGHQDASVEKIIAQDGNFFVTEAQAADFDHVDPGVIEEVRISDTQNAAVGIDLERGDLLKRREIQVAVGKIG